MNELSKLFVVIGAKTEEFQQGMKDLQSSAQSSIGKLNSLLGGLLPEMSMAAVVAGMGAIASNLMNLGEDLTNTAIRTGMSTQALQELGYAAEKGGSSLDQVRVGMQQFARVLLDAENGSVTAVRTFQQLGLSFNDLQQMDPESQFKAIARALNNIPDPTQRAALAMEIFGRSGTELLPMIGNLDTYISRLHELGILSDAQVTALADTKGATEDLHTAWQGLTGALAATVFPSLTSFIGDLATLVGYIKQAVDWMNKLNSTLSRLDLSKILNMPSWFTGGLSQLWASPGSESGGAVSTGGMSQAEISQQNYLAHLQGYQSGGIVPGSIGEPQLAMVHGGEVISPAGGSGVNITVSQLIVREEADVQRIAKELYRLQQLRKSYV
ncbi:MAG: hypothetical protein ABSB38_03580 [Dehalococcoidia bacterium]